MMRRDELFSAFESIGNNCEFGIVQDAAGYRALSLFGSAGYGSVTQIIHAMSCGLDGMFDDGSYEFIEPGGWPDYAVHCRLFGFIFHTELPITDPKSNLEFPKRIRSLRRLKEKFLSDLRDGSKIFVYRGLEGINDYLARSLAACIRQHGPGRLLWVGEDKRPERRFAWVEPSGFDGLLYGGMPDLSNSAPVRIGYDAWESIARQALVHFREEIRSPRQPRTAAPTMAGVTPDSRALRNLALHCSTRQSSVSKWSNSDTPEADSAGAVNGRLDQKYAFHTLEEDVPWWEVDLGQNCLFEAVVIHNRVDHTSIAQRAFPLSILLSLDQTDWTLAHTISADESTISHGNRPLIWHPPEPAIARYVRLQIARRSILHLVQVEVFGRSNTTR
jgi:F5/8 type C domain